MRLSEIKPLQESYKDKIYYHATNADFDEFSHRYTGSVGFYFSDDYNFIKPFIKNRGNDVKVISAKLDIKNPAFYDSPDFEKASLMADKYGGGNPNKYIREYLKNLGYDAIVFKKETRVFEPNQITIISKDVPLSEKVSKINLLELTIEDLNKNTIKFPKKSRCRDLKTYLVNVQGLKFTPFSESNELWVTSSTQSSGHPDHYKTEIIFKDVDFIDDDSGVSFTGSDNAIHNIKPLLARINDCEVYCECADYKYRMQAANYSKNAGIFPADNYIKKTNRPPINPEKIPFLCKHLLSMVNQLTQKRILRYV